MAARIRVGLIGCGFFAQNHLNAWKDLAADAGQHGQAPDHAVVVGRGGRHAEEACGGQFRPRPDQIDGLACRGVRTRVDAAPRRDARAC